MMCASLQVPDVQPVSLSSAAEVENYEVCRVCVEELALYLKPISGAKGLCSYARVFLMVHLRVSELFVQTCAGAARLSCLCNLAFVLLTLTPMTPESCCTFMVLEEN